VKVACTVWRRGKSGDDLKGLPIPIVQYGYNPYYDEPLSDA